MQYFIIFSLGYILGFFTCAILAHSKDKESRHPPTPPQKPETKDHASDAVDYYVQNHFYHRTASGGNYFDREKINDLQREFNRQLKQNSTEE